MAPKLVMTGLELFPVPQGNFVSVTNTTEMAKHVPLVDFLTFWKGIPASVDEEVRAIVEEWASKGRLYTPTIESSGTTLAHVMPFMKPETQSMVHTLLAVHYYRLFDATP